MFLAKKMNPIKSDIKSHLESESVYALTLLTKECATHSSRLSAINRSLNALENLNNIKSNYNIRK